MFVKICGLSDRAAIDAAVDAGANAIGFVFAKSVREIAPVRARELCRDLPPEVCRIAVMHHPSPERYLDVIDTFDPDWIQSDADDFAGLPQTERSRVLPVYREGEQPPRGNWPTRLLFEGVASGSGTTADWDQAKLIAQGAELILAGGLDSENVAAAIKYVRPWGVDVSSGVEHARGQKDPRKIGEFVARVRALEND